MILKVAICDDEKSAVEQADNYLSRIRKETDLDFQIYYYSSGEDLVENMPRDIHILLLDIQMLTLSGIEAARKLREEGGEFYLVFLTSNTQYALEGYSVHAYEFLCKPIQYVQFKRCILEISEKIRRSRSVRIPVKSGSASYVIDFAHVIYAEVYGHTTVIRMDDGTSVNGSVPLDQLEKKLSDHGFFRCHKSYLINVYRIKSIQTGEIIMSDGSSVPLSRYKKKEFLLFFNEAIGAAT